MVLVLGLERVPFSLACGFQAGQALVVASPDRVTCVAHLLQNTLVKGREFGLRNLLDIRGKRSKIGRGFSSLDLGHHRRRDFHSRGLVVHDNWVVDGPCRIERHACQPRRQVGCRHWRSAATRVPTRRVRVWVRVWVCVWIRIWVGVVGVVVWLVVGGLVERGCSRRLFHVGRGRGARV